MRKLAEGKGVEPFTISGEPGFRDRLPANPALPSFATQRDEMVDDDLLVPGVRTRTHF
jgi:hypothetical protein